MSGKIRVATLAIAATITLSGLATAQDYYRFYDRDYGYRHYDRDDYGYNRTAFRVARDFGYEDGSWVARRDIAEAKPYNPFPRGGFKHEDHGYRREYGDKYAYREAYARAYREVTNEHFDDTSFPTLNLWSDQKTAGVRLSDTVAVAC